jgi:polyketide synthase PksM
MPLPATSSARALTVEEIQSEMVARIGKALGLPPHEIDVDAAFVDHGLDSVAALQMVGELETVLGRPLEATLMFEYPSIATLSRHLASE